MATLDCEVNDVTVISDDGKLVLVTSLDCEACVIVTKEDGEFEVTSEIVTVLSEDNDVEIDGVKLVSAD